MPALQTDYLVIGAGAIGMAFVDTLLTDTDAQIVIVDRHPRRRGGTGIKKTPRKRRVRRARGKGRPAGRG